MRELEELRNNPALKNIKKAKGIFGDVGLFECDMKLPLCKARILFSYREHGYEHVSVCPNNVKYNLSWDDMCRVKETFFKANELVVQIHPPEDEYVHGVGNRENILHLYRPVNGDFSILNEK